MHRTLVAGFGNVLRGDDGFGVAVIRRLYESGGLPPDVDLLDVGTGGVRLAQELLNGYDRLIVVDAMSRAGMPGVVYVLAVESVEAAMGIDMHLAIPSRALAVAKTLGVLPATIWMVGCEPEVVDDLVIGLTPTVQRSVEVAMERVMELIGSGDVATVVAGATDA